MKYTDQQRIDKMIVTTRKLLQYLSDHQICTIDILSQEPLRWTITTPLYNIGEHAYFISDAFKMRHEDVPWAKIAGLRHRLVHDCDDTNWSLICRILFEVLPGFLKDLEEIEEKDRSDQTE